jgi:hypothetical protein
MRPKEKLNLLQKFVIFLVCLFVLLVFYGSYLDYLWIKRHTIEKVIYGLPERNWSN